MNTIKEKIYIVGHTKPDLDSIVSAIGYAKFRQACGHYEYHAIRCDRVNPLTKYIFTEYETELPQYIPNISGLNVILVDHSAPENRASGWEYSRILGVIDHHEVKLHDVVPHIIKIRPCGSTTTLITEKFFKKGIQIQHNLANILLSGILDDTLGLKSPTTIQLDIDMVNWLNRICKIPNLWEFSEKMFSKKDIWHTLTPREIIEMDIKNIEFGTNMVSISQVETLNNRNLKEKNILEELDKMNTLIPFNLRLVMLTDLLKNDCILLATGPDLHLLESSIGKKMENNRVYLKDVVSRKKQIVPILKNIYSNN